MSRISVSELPDVWLAKTPVGRIQRRLTAAAMLALSLGVLAIFPFRNAELGMSYGFVPFVQGLMFVAELVTAILLYTQFAIIGTRALLVLASGYLFAALLLVAHTLAFQSLFLPGSILPAGPQTAAWLYAIGHFAFPAAVAVYAWTKDGADSRDEHGPGRRIMQSVILVSCLVIGITWVVTAADHYMPTMMLDSTTFAPLARHVGASSALVCVLAIVLLWTRSDTVLDRWLMVVMFSAMIELSMISFVAQRFSFGWYSIRLFAVIASTIVLLALLTEATRLYAKLAAATRAFERAQENRLLSAQAVTASIAHEIRQPLAGAAASAAAAARCLDAVPPNIDLARSAARRIVEGCHRVSETLDGMRALFGEIDPKRWPIDLNRLITDELQSLYDDLNSNHVDIRLDLEADLPRVMGHAGQLREVVANLVRNAIDAMRTSSHRNHILTVRTQSRAKEVVVMVGDTGPGIDPEHLSGIFGAFVTTKAHGMGLGLAISRMIVEQHGGQLAVGENGNTGALMQVVLPRDEGGGIAPAGSETGLPSRIASKPAADEAVSGMSSIIHAA